MSKFNKFFADHGIKIVLALMLLTYFKSCSIDSEVERIKKEQRILTTEIDTLSTQIVNEEEMIYLIKTIPAWKTLRIEEISDKERISINALEEKDRLNVAGRVPIIPGVPTPSDPQCSLTYCGRIIAQVDCIKYIMQGTTACIDIQLFGNNDLPLNLDNFCDIHIQLTNELECVVANFWWPRHPFRLKRISYRYFTIYRYIRCCT